MTRRLRIAAVIALFAMLAVACGQLPGTRDQVTSQGFTGTGGQGTTSGGADGTGGTIAGGTAADGTTGTTSGGAGGGGSQATVGGGGGGGTSGGGGQGQLGAAGGGDTTGVTEDTITIGVHAPVTGAAPVQSEVFRAGKDLYFRWLKDQGKSIHGRNVEVLFRDDQYSASHASNVCQEMTRQGNAFLLIGGAGTDQIVACARYSDSQGIPYLSNGVTERVLEDLGTYFAISPSYNDQGPLSAQMILNKFGRDEMDVNSAGGLRQPDGALKVAFVMADSPNFEDGEEGFRQGFEEQGFSTQSCDQAGATDDCYQVYTLPKKDSPTLRTAVSSAVSDMQQKGIDVINTLIAPVVVIQVVQEADSRQYAPKWVGYGVSTVNAVMEFVCESNPSTSYSGNAVFFPWPGWREVHQGQFDTEFHQAVQKFASEHDNPGDGDLLLSLWSAGKIVAQMLQATGPNPTREGFMQTLEQGGPFETGVYPALQFQPRDGGHFGTKTVHLLEGRCEGAAGEFFTNEPFASGW